MAKTLVVVGAGGFGREVLDVVDAINAAADEQQWDVLGVADDNPSPENVARLDKREVKLLGGIEAALELEAAHYVIGIGSPRVRRLIAERFDTAGWQAATLIHPSATFGFDVTLGAGSVICAGATLSTNIHAGVHLHVNPNATIGHDTILGDYVSLNPLASISGDCAIEDDVLVGVAGVVFNQLTVGAGATVGGSACVVRDVPAGAVVKGVPAK